MSQQALLQLEQVEQKIIELMKIASEVAQLLANIDGNEDTSNLVHSKASEYVSILKEIQAALRQQAQKLPEYVPLNQTLYGSTLDLQISIQRSQLIHKQLQEMTTIFSQYSTTPSEEEDASP